MNGPALLKKTIGRLKSRMGGFIPGERVVFRGHDLHSQLKDMDWVELYVFGITGRRFSREQLRLLHAMWSCTSYPDARLWNNRVAALAGSARSTGNLGAAAALAISEASIFGRGIDIRAIEFLIRTKKAIEDGRDLAECIREELGKHRSIAGYGRPLTSEDERIKPIMNLAQTLGLADGEHVRLAFAIEETLLAGRWRMRMNYAALAAAFAADMGFSPSEYYLYSFPAFLAGMQPCFIEAAERPEGTLFPISCEQILYEGQPKRSWSRTS